MATLPKTDQWVAMSTVESPVTQMVETAVKNASASGVPERSRAAMGSDSTSVRITISEVKMRMAKRAGDTVAKSSTMSRKRLTGGAGRPGLRRITVLRDRKSVV